MFTLIIKGYSHINHNFLIVPSTHKDINKVSISVTMSLNSIIHFTSSPHTSCILWAIPIECLQSHYFCIINVIDQNRDLMDGMGWRALCLSAERRSQRTNLRFEIRLIQWQTNLALISNQLTQQGPGIRLQTLEIVRIVLTLMENSRWKTWITNLQLM